MSVQDRLEAKVDRIPIAGCWLWNGAQNDGGYGYFYYQGRLQPAHRIAWLVYEGQNPGKLFVLHRCDTRSCINPEHLFLGDHADNMRDMATKARSASGNLNGNSKLTSDEVRLIRNDHRSGIEIALAFGISREQVWNIKTGKQWSHIK